MSVGSPKQTYGAKGNPIRFSPSMKKNMRVSRRHMNIQV